MDDEKNVDAATVADAHASCATRDELYAIAHALMPPGRAVDPETVEPNITHAVVLYAALLYRERTSPAGFSGYDVDGGGDFANQSAMTNIYRLLGSRKPVAR